MFKTDLEIAQECKMEHIRDIAAKIGVGEEDLEYYGNYKAKVSLDLLHRNEDKEDGKLILVTAINPTKAGEGKSTTTVGLGDALNRLGKKTMIALREPSLGPGSFILAVETYFRIKHEKAYKYHTISHEISHESMSIFRT